MKQFKKWMHEKGRSAVMVIMVLAALGIVLHYYVTMDNDSAGSVRLSQAALSNSLKETKLPQKAELGGSEYYDKYDILLEGREEKER